MEWNRSYQAAQHGSELSRCANGFNLGIGRIDGSMDEFVCTFELSSHPAHQIRTQARRMNRLEFGQSLLLGCKVTEQTIQDLYKHVRSQSRIPRDISLGGLLMVHSYSLDQFVCTTISQHVTHFSVYQRT